MIKTWVGYDEGDPPQWSEIPYFSPELCYYDHQLRYFGSLDHLLVELRIHVSWYPGKITPNDTYCIQRHCMGFDTPRGKLAIHLPVLKERRQSQPVMWSREEFWKMFQLCSSGLGREKVLAALLLKDEAPILQGLS